MWKNVVVVVGVVLVVMVVAFVKSQRAGDERSAGAALETNATAAKLPRLVELGAGKCVACRRMKPIIAELEKTHAGRLQVESIDVIDEAETARAYAWHVIPCQVFLDADGEELWRHEGSLSRDAILTKWAELGYSFGEVTTSRPSEAS
jgi:thioredoxin 1